ncbi:MAG: acyl-CoA thioesterase [Rhodobacteraceae bacterium]|nr:acyl-CoA thioesterase [Paracoccaceae bacterium]
MISAPTGSFHRHETVHWGDCDAAGIVFYPNFYRWADNSFHALTRALGFDQASLSADHGILGTPLVETSARFAAPARPGDRLDIAVRITRIGRSSCALHYAMALDGRAVADVQEARVFVRQTGTQLAPCAIPDAIRAAMAPHFVTS